MIFVENAARFREIEFVFRRLAPRQFEHEVEIRADDVIVRRRLRQTFQTFQLTFSFGAHVIRQICFFETLAQQLRFSRFARLVFAEFFLNRAHLLAQHVIALSLVHFDLGFGSDLRAQLHDLELAREIRVGHPQQLVSGIGLEHLLLFFNAESQY